MDSETTSFEQRYGISEAYFLETIGRIARLVSGGFVFGYYSKSDIAQQCHLFALQALAKGVYDPQRAPLDAFLYRHVINNLVKLKRDKNFRREGPCKNCPLFDEEKENQCGAFDDKRECKPYMAWYLRNSAKAALMAAAPDGGIVRESAPERTEAFDLEALLDAQIPANLRPIYLKMKEGLSVSRTKRELVQRAVSAILDNHK